MGAGALTARLGGLARPVATGAGELAVGLAVDRPGGPLVAVCATAGGAGASTLALLLAAQAARESRAPVLACDTGGPTAGLARLAGVESRHTLAELGEEVKAGARDMGGVFAAGPHGLHVVAGGPRFRNPGSTNGLEAVLEQARAAHGLTVVDCGTLQRAADQVAFELATHRLWVVPAHSDGVRSAARALEQIRRGEVPEAIVARAHRGARPALGALRRLAEARGGPLVLLPAISGEDPTCEAALARSQGALAALAGWLRR